MTHTIGISLRKSPYQWDAQNYNDIHELNFDYWDVPAWMILDHILIPPPGTGCLVSDIYSYAVLSNIAIDGNEKMYADLAENLTDILETLTPMGVHAISLDFGLGELPEENDAEITESRFKLLRLLWQVCHQAGIRLLMPIQVPFETAAHETWIKSVIRRAMCANLGYIADINVHKILRVPDPSTLLKPIIFDTGLVRLCWNAEDGNTIRPEWFMGWQNWFDTAAITVPIVFEPVQHQADGFQSHAETVAKMSGKIKIKADSIILE